jgi:peptide chain release factor 1
MIEKSQIDRILARLPEIEAELSSPATASNQKRFRELVREHANLKKLDEKASRFFSIQKTIREHEELIGSPDADAELRELAQSEMGELKKAMPVAELDLTEALLPPDPNVARNAIMEIRAGTGGAEAALFAGDLFRMYNRYAEDKGLKVSPVDASPGESGGYKEVILTIEGEGAYNVFQYEGGGHRVQRIPETEAQGRIHTSAATVAVFPEAEEDDEIEIKPEELRIDLFCASGPGGQKVNKTESAVRLTHLPTGIVVQSQDERSQHRNREKAMAVLKARILDAKRREEDQKMGATRRSMIGSGDRSERIRTYNFPQNRVTDHRINLTLYSLNQVMEGKLEELIGALHKHDVELRLQAQVKG